MKTIDIYKVVCVLISSFGFGIVFSVLLQDCFTTTTIVLRIGWCSLWSAIILLQIPYLTGMVDKPL